MVVKKFKDIPEGQFLIGAYAPDAKNVVSSYRLGGMNGHAMRAVALAMRNANKKARADEGMYAGGMSILADIGGFAAVKPMYDNLVIGDRDMILTASKIRELLRRKPDNPTQDISVACPLPVLKDGEYEECGAKQTFAFDFREIDVNVPEESDITWFRVGETGTQYPCFTAQGPGIEKGAVVRYTSTVMDLFSRREGRIEQEMSAYYVLSQAIMEWNGESLSADDIRRLRRYHFFKDQEETLEIGSDALHTIAEAYKKHRVGPDFTVNVRCGACGGRFPYEVEVISHFL